MGAGEYALRRKGLTGKDILYHPEKLNDPVMGFNLKSQPDIAIDAWSYPGPSITMAMVIMWRFTADTSVWLFVVITSLVGLGMAILTGISIFVVRWAESGGGYHVLHHRL
jgi:hypothetical protein